MRFKHLPIAVLLAMGNQACVDTTDPLEEGAWHLVSSHSLAVPEPSGLCLDSDGRHLWTVSDETGQIYRLDLEGRIVQQLAFSGEDLEGVCLDPTDGSLWLAEERRRQAVHVSREGALLGRLPINLAGTGNSGLEGICLDSRGRLLLVNEKEPGRLLRLDRQSGQLEPLELGFARDYSGLCWDSGREALWVVSDESRALFLVNQDQSVLRYSLGFSRLEGVAVLADTAWVVSDSQTKLFRIQFD